MTAFQGPTNHPTLKSAPREDATDLMLPTSLKVARETRVETWKSGDGRFFFEIGDVEIDKNSS